MLHIHTQAPSITDTTDVRFFGVRFTASCISSCCIWSFPASWTYPLLLRHTTFMKIKPNTCYWAYLTGHSPGMEVVDPDCLRFEPPIRDSCPVTAATIESPEKAGMEKRGKTQIEEVRWIRRCLDPNQWLPPPPILFPVLLLAVNPKPWPCSFNFPAPWWVFCCCSHSRVMMCAFSNGSLIATMTLSEWAVCGVVWWIIGTGFTIQPGWPFKAN